MQHILMKICIVLSFFERKKEPLQAGQGPAEVEEATEVAPVSFNISNTGDRTRIFFGGGYKDCILAESKTRFFALSRNSSDVMCLSARTPEDFKDQRERLPVDRPRTFKFVFLAHQTIALGLDRVTRLSAAVVDGTISQSSIPRGRRRVRTAFFSSHVRLPRHHDLRAGAASGCHSHDCVALCRNSATSRWSSWAAAIRPWKKRCF